MLLFLSGVPSAPFPSFYISLGAAGVGLRPTPVMPVAPHPRVPPGSLLAPNGACNLPHRGTLSFLPFFHSTLVYLMSFVNLIYKCLFVFLSQIYYFVTFVNNVNPPLWYSNTVNYNIGYCYNTVPLLTIILFVHFVSLLFLICK